jgi:ketosteroid isomerase-like protein
LAYTQGTYEFTATDPKSGPVNDRGKFVVVWKKQTDGGWKIAADIWNSDLPPAAAPAP